MKKILFIIVAVSLYFIVSGAELFAQDTGNQSTETKYTARDIYPFGVGLAISFKGGVNTMDPPDGVKNDYVFTAMPDIGAQVYLPFGTENNMGIVFDLAYLSFPYKFKLYGQEDVNWTDKVSYFAIAPNFHISGFLIGFNFGFPLAAASDNNVAGNSYTYNYQKDNMKFIIDAHIGALIPLINTETGRFNLLIQAEYPLSDIFENDLVTNNTKEAFNVQPVAIKFGLSYIFNTSLLQKK